MRYFPKCNFDPEEFMLEMNRIYNSPAQKLSGSLKNGYEYGTKAITTHGVVYAKPRPSIITEQLTAQQVLMMPEAIKEVIFHDPATIVYWLDGTKTVVKAQDETFDPEKGLAMAICKKIFGNEGCYYKIFKKWLPKEEKSENFKPAERVCSGCRFDNLSGRAQPCRSCFMKYDRPGFQPKVKE